MRTVVAEVPREPDHVPLAVVEYGGVQWLVREVDTANGVTVLERVVPDALPADAPPEYVRVQRWGWPPALVAIFAVVLFLMLLASIGERLTFEDAVGAVIGFVVLIVLLDRREDTRPPAQRTRWFWL